MVSFFPTFYMELSQKMKTKVYSNDLSAVVKNKIKTLTLMFYNFQYMAGQQTLTIQYKTFCKLPNFFFLYIIFKYLFSSNSNNYQFLFKQKINLWKFLFWLSKSFVTIEFYKWDKWVIKCNPFAKKWPNYMDQFD
jgi:hypothetical protein